jgi:hypothetical protein
MSKDLSFALDPKGGEDILQKLALATIRKSADAIATRARSMAASMTSNPPEITVQTKVGIIKRGTRAIATIAAVGVDRHASYIGHQALVKAKDAGRV